MRMRLADHIWAHTPLRLRPLFEGAKILLWPCLCQILVPRRSLTLLLRIKGKKCINVIAESTFERNYLARKSLFWNFIDNFCRCAIKYISLLGTKMLLSFFCLFRFVSSRHVTSRLVSSRRITSRFVLFLREITLDVLKSPSSCLFSTRRTKDFPTWLPPILATQKRVAALQPIWGPLDIPWGPNCQAMGNEMWLAVKFNMGSIAKAIKLQRPREIM